MGYSADPSISMPITHGRQQPEDAGYSTEDSNRGKIHDAVVDDRIDEVRRILQDDPGSVNETDEMVRSPSPSSFNDSSLG